MHRAVLFFPLYITHRLQQHFALYAPDRFDSLDVEL